jgi:hypothetical protein
MKDKEVMYRVGNGVEIAVWFAIAEQAVALIFCL